MPSWNIHTAHVERLLHDEGPLALGVGDVNCFLFGNYVPDIYVGYMVPDVTHTVPYHATHLATPHTIPIPRSDEFWNTYVAGAQEQGRPASDVCLGAWAHLVCDNVYNTNVRAFNVAHGVQAGEQTRIRKQGDFDRFGRTLPITMRVALTDELVAECEAFPQYPILEPDVERSVAVADAIVDENAVHPRGEGADEPEYSLLTEDFFFETFERANRALLLRLRDYGAWRRSLG
ncbi:MAG: hypothetical protein PHR15_03925 [Atopobiaceae bacterium]|jgi:hypothetical protein|nr:hypothetical protein [Atopobiaceae bacterium]MCH4180180.1 hypothetical protein [Atopobiaceae bacterium]MCH4214350.1 hypothetical protein [Atopobiaceae bacterium]MCH4229219.1 hypothetical protein [Atopobiaceae bacterium]MCH4276590.1 hypothetical protein [Atopobiaceae bacterium]